MVGLGDYCGSALNTRFFGVGSRRTVGGGSDKSCSEKRDNIINIRPNVGCCSVRCLPPEETEPEYRRGIVRPLGKVAILYAAERKVARELRASALARSPAQAPP